jgi:natural product biosynthesis luciferase-like monooxygenase protein
MSDVDERLRSLTPEQRRLLELRLRRAAPAVPSTAIRSSGSSGPDGSNGSTAPGPPVHSLSFSLFFFSADGSSGERDKYRLLLECARFADREGFAAVWTPERHFQDFGGLYPNPAVVGAALAMITERVEIRAGSVVLPLHHPVRVAEEWGVVDNLSGGRVAISCATGWHPADFVLRPETWEERREVMYRDIALLRRLWAGETVTLPGGGGFAAEVRMLPRPVRPELPIWVTSSGSRDTWERAGTVGANVLAQLANQPLPEVADKVTAYRAARTRAGHAGPGTVTLMLHTYLEDDPASARAAARQPLRTYLRTHVRQRDSFADRAGVTAASQEELLDLATEHYLESASLIGSPATCDALLAQLAALGVDEIACLVDFGLAPDQVLGGLERLADVRRRQAVGVEEEATPGTPPAPRS